MCKIGGGANRCDAHWGPAQKAADLAKRRAKYAAKKGGNVRSYQKSNEAQRTALIETPTDTTIESCTDFFRDHSFFTEIKNLNESYVQGETETVEKLGITKTAFTGSLVDEKYFSATQVEGTINWENLDEESYKEFGFQEISEARKLGVISHVDLSAYEIGEISEDENTLLSKFTDSDFQWINSALYNEGRSDKFAKNVVAPSYKGQDLELRDSDDTYEQTKEMLEVITDGLDNFIENNSTRQQRVVYRGLKSELKAIQNAGGIEAYMNSFQLGQEMVFDGYQSSSLNPGIAMSFSDTYSNSEEDPQGVILEIVSASGVNIQSRSTFNHEYEVLLPRNARYMVVGVHKKVEYLAANRSSPAVANVIQLVEITEEGKMASVNDKPATPPALTEKQTRTRK